MGVLGAHGSCDGITKGRGRSPLNWALMIGAKKFEVSIFKISDGVDDGDDHFVEQTVTGGECHYRGAQAGHHLDHGHGDGRAHDLGYPRMAGADVG